MDDLEQKLIETQHLNIRLIAVDGVFSMDGDIADLKQIVYLAKKYNAYTFVDECHGAGVLGLTGRGTPEHCGVEGEIDIINSTLGKALGGGTGGYTAANQKICDMLRVAGRPYLYSNSILPAVVGATLECLKMLEESNELVEKL